MDRLTACVCFCFALIFLTSCGSASQPREAVAEIAGADPSLCEQFQVEPMDSSTHVRLRKENDSEFATVTVELTKECQEAYGCIHAPSGYEYRNVRWLLPTNLQSSLLLLAGESAVSHDVQFGFCMAGNYRQLSVPPGDLIEIIYAKTTSERKALSHVVSVTGTPPLNNRIHDLEVVMNHSLTSGSQLQLINIDTSWSFNQRGDLDGNGVTAVTDLSRLGDHMSSPEEVSNLDLALSEISSGMFSSSASYIDGDHNGLVNITDISAIGGNVGLEFTDWNLMYNASDDATEAGNQTLFSQGRGESNAMFSQKWINQKIITDSGVLEDVVLGSDDSYFYVASKFSGYDDRLKSLRRRTSYKLTDTDVWEESLPSTYLEAEPVALSGFTAANDSRHILVAVGPYSVDPDDDRPVILNYGFSSGGIASTPAVIDLSQIDDTSTTEDDILGSDKIVAIQPMNTDQGYNAAVLLRRTSDSSAVILCEFGLSSTVTIKAVQIDYEATSLAVRDVFADPDGTDDVLVLPKSGGSARLLGWSSGVFNDQTIVIGEAFTSALMNDLDSNDTSTLSELVGVVNSQITSVDFDDDDKAGILNPDLPLIGSILPLRVLFGSIAIDKAKWFVSGGRFGHEGDNLRAVSFALPGSSVFAYYVPVEPTEFTDPESFNLGGVRLDILDSLYKSGSQTHLDLTCCRAASLDSEVDDDLIYTTADDIGFRFGNGRIRSNNVFIPMSHPDDDNDGNSNDDTDHDDIGDSQLLFRSSTFSPIYMIRDVQPRLLTTYDLEADSSNGLEAVCVRFSDGQATLMVVSI